MLRCYFRMVESGRVDGAYGYAAAESAMDLFYEIDQHVDATSVEVCEVPAVNSFALTVANDGEGVRMSGFDSGDLTSAVLGGQWVRPKVVFKESGGRELMLPWVVKIG